MRRFIPRSLIILLSGLILFLFSCTSGSCFDETNSFLKASLYKYTTKKAQAPDSLTIYGRNMETDTLYKKSSGVKLALLPLNTPAGNCIFIIKINDITDTMELWYSSYPHLISKECGYTFYHNLDSLTFTRNGIDSISKIKNNITTLNEENIRIFY